MLAVFLPEPLHYGCALKYVSMLLLSESEHITVVIFRPGSYDSISVKYEAHRLGVFHRLDYQKLGCIWMGLCI